MSRAKKGFSLTKECYHEKALRTWYAEAGMEMEEVRGAQWIISVGVDVKY